MPQWVVPWIIIGLVIYPLRLVEGWIHKHIQGLGLLITNNPQAAVLIYYFSLLPGVFLHEASQWVLAKALRVKVKRFQLWPDRQRGGLIRLGLVEIDGKTDIVRTSLIGVIPMITGIAAIALIASANFNTQALVTGLGSGDMPTIIAGFGEFTSTPDFFLWIYLVFTIANAMLPEPHDEINWWIFLGVIAGIVVFLLVLDLSILLRAGLEGPLASLSQWVSLALVLSLGLDLCVMGLIAFSEWLFSRLLNRELEYR